MTAGSSSSLLVPCDPPSPARHDRSFPGSDIELVSLAPTADHSITEQSGQNADYEPTRAYHSMAHLVDAKIASLHGVEDGSPVRHLSPSLGSGKPSAMKRLLLDTWTCEIIAMTFSIGCLVAIMIVVGAYDGKRITQLASGLTLNTIISVLSTAARSSLVFVVSAAVGQLKWCWLKRSARQVRDIQAMDEASRGPLGAIGVIAFWTGGNLAAMGSFVTILMTAFSPFVQQLVEYPSRNTIQPDAIALAPQNLVYADINNLEEVIEAGTWSVQKGFDQEPICPTSQCLWPRFQSIGWCSKCEDCMRSATLNNCRLSTIVRNETELSQYCVLDLGNGANSSLLKSGLQKIEGYEPPAGLEYSVSFQFTEENTWPVSDGGYADSSDGFYTPLMENNEVYSEYIGIYNPLMVFGHVKIEETQLADRREDLHYDILRIVNASQCVLTVCEKSLLLKKVDGTTTWADESTNYGDMFGTVVEVLLGEGPERRPYQRNLLCWQAEGGQNNFTTFDKENSSYLNKTKRAFCDLYLFVGAVEGQLVDESTSKGFIVGENSRSRFAKRTSYTVGRNSTRNLSQRLESIAAALTNYGLATTNDTVRGDAYAEESYVRVRWQWAILPAFLELASLLLLFLTIVHSRRNDVPIWKSSVLALMYHGVDELQDRGTFASERLSGMELIAKVTDVQLVKNEDGVNSLERRRGYIAGTEDK
jgi:hypothetical protein